MTSSWPPVTQVRFNYDLLLQVVVLLKEIHQGCFLTLNLATWLDFFLYMVYKTAVRAELVASNTICAVEGLPLASILQSTDQLSIKNTMNNSSQYSSSLHTKHRRLGCNGQDKLSPSRPIPSL